MASSKGDIRDTRARRVISVEIGADAVHAMELELRGAAARTVRQGSSPVSPNTWDDLARERERVAHAIRSAMANAGIRGTRAVTTLPRRFVTIKYARLPQGTPEQVAGMVRFEAQQYVPFPIEEVVLDHQIVSDPSDEMATVMVVAARRALVNDLLAAFDKAGIEITRVSVTSLALAEHLREETMPVALCREIGGQLDIAVAGAGRVLFSRSADLIASDGQASPTDALVSELARSLAAYQNEYRARPVERVVLAQDARGAATTPEAVEAALQIPVTVLQTDGAAPSTGAVATGLAMHESAVAMTTTNLLPSERIERRAEARRRAVGRLTAAGAAAAVLVAVWLGQQGLAAHARERRLAGAENARLKRILPSVMKADAHRDRLERMYSAVSHGLGRDRPVVDVLKVVSDAIPTTGRLHLTQLTFDRNGPVVLHGNADAQEAATQFLTRLQKSGMFAEARLGYLGDAKSEGGAVATSGPAATAAGSSMSFMVYCRLPQPPSDEDQKAGARRRASGSMARGVAGQ